jgi:hypothetical protein
MALQVLSAPQGQPTLNPQVQSAPVQPTLAPRVLSAPTNAPTLAPKVVTQPQQPTLNPQVQTTPPGQQQNLPISYGKVIDAIVAAKARGADATSILQAIMTQNPDKAPVLQTALDRGATPEQIIDKIIQDNYASPDQAAQQQGQPGLIQQAAVGLGRIVATPAVRLLQLGGGLAGAQDTTLNVPGLGKFDAPGIENGVANQDWNKNLKKAVGEEAKVISLGLGPVGGGAAFGFGDALENNRGLLGTAAETVGGAAAGKLLQFGADKIVAPIASKVAGLLPDSVQQGASDLANAGKGLTQPIRDFAANTDLLPKAASDIVNKLPTAAEQIANAPFKLVGKPFQALKNAVSPDVQVALTKAIKPAAKNFQFGSDLQSALPDIVTTAQKEGLPLDSLENLKAAIGQAKQGVWKEYQSLLGPNAKATIDGNQIADAMVSSIDQRFRLQNPAAADRIEAIANTYRRDLSLQDAENFLQSANNDLNSYYAKNKVSQRVAQADPTIGYVVNEADALRNSLYGKLDELTGKSAATIKQRYGALSNMENAVSNRVNVAARQNPDSLAEQIGVAQGLANLGGSVVRGNIGDAVKGGIQMTASHLLKVRNTSDSLVENAFKKYQGNVKNVLIKIPRGAVPTLLSGLKSNPSGSGTQ